MSTAFAHTITKYNRSLLASARGRKRRLIKSYSEISNDKYEGIATENKPWVTRRLIEDVKRTNRKSHLRTIIVFAFLTSLLVMAFIYLFLY